MNQVSKLLTETCPSWFTITESSGGEIQGTPSLLGSSPSWAQLNLSIDCDATPRVKETSKGQCLPAYCPERHINPDASFCLGLEQSRVEDERTATEFWDNLKRYLTLQRIADVNRSWPEENSWDHADAAVYQRDAESLAASLGLQHEYREARSGRRSWLTSPRTKMVDRNGNIINTRRVCPKGCKYPRRSTHQQIRRNCPNSNSIAELINLERKRRAHLLDFWREMRRNSICCGTLNDCPHKYSESELISRYGDFTR